MRTAIIDLGTNTFNLLITELTADNKVKYILSSKEQVMLGKEGINSNMISPGAFERGLSAIGNHMKTIGSYRVMEVHAFATSAIRSADNGTEFINSVSRKFNIGVRVISGNKEAELIYLGVKQVVNMDGKKYLIIDIGGGSNELIIADSDKIYWKKSFPLGMARLLEKFKPSNPIEQNEIVAIENYISHTLRSFFEASIIHKPASIIGSSGSFDTFRNLLMALDEKNLAGIYRNKPSFEFSSDEFSRLYSLLINSTAIERSAMKGMDPMRVEMIVIAGIFVNFIARRLNTDLLIQSDYALKEGAVVEIMKQHIESLQQ